MTLLTPSFDPETTFDQLQKLDALYKEFIKASDQFDSAYWRMSAANANKLKDDPHFHINIQFSYICEQLVTLLMVLIRHNHAYVRRVAAERIFNMYIERSIGIPNNIVCGDLLTSFVEEEVKSEEFEDLFGGYL